VFAAQTESNFAGYSSEDLVGRVNHKPFMHHVSGFCAESFHELLFKKFGLPGATMKSLSWTAPEWFHVYSTVGVLLMRTS
jgi:hypothetical protein